MLLKILTSSGSHLVKNSVPARVASNIIPSTQLVDSVAVCAKGLNSSDAGLFLRSADLRIVQNSSDGLTAADVLDRL